MFGEQFYPTPPELARWIISQIDYKKIGLQRLRVLDPSAGSGAFLDAYLDMVVESVEADNFRLTESWEKHKTGVRGWNSYPSTYDVEKEVGKSKEKAHAIEIDGNLQSVLLGKGYKVIDADFLQHASRNHYNLVLMNPPFNKGAKHLLYAFENISFDNLACVLNAETLRNPHSYEREKLVKIIADNGYRVEYKSAAFSDADRKTNVEIAVVFMAKEAVKNI